MAFLLWKATAANLLLALAKMHRFTCWMERRPLLCTLFAVSALQAAVVCGMGLACLFLVRPPEWRFWASACVVLGTACAAAAAVLLDLDAAAMPERGPQEGPPPGSDLVAPTE